MVAFSQKAHFHLLTKLMAIWVLAGESIKENSDWFQPLFELDLRHLELQ